MKSRLNKYKYFEFQLTTLQALLLYRTLCFPPTERKKQVKIR